MDLFERYFEISPDGGNGITEASYIIAGAFLVWASFRRRLLIRYAWRECLKLFFSTGS
jgi:hypothetical protein